MTPLSSPRQECTGLDCTNICATAFLSRTCVLRWDRVRWPSRSAVTTPKRENLWSFLTTFQADVRSSVNGLCWGVWGEAARCRSAPMLQPKTRMGPGGTRTASRRAAAESRRGPHSGRGLQPGSAGAETAMSKVIVMKARPLAGRRVLVTRASGQAFGLSHPLRDLGAEVIEIPTIEIRSAGSSAALEHALIKIDHYDTLILTSVNGVERLFDRYNRLGLPIEDMKHLLVVAIGPATAAAIQSEGLGVSIVPEKYVAESVIEALRGKIFKGSRVLLVRAKVARDVLPDELRKAGATVEVIEAYETVVPEGAAERLNKIFANPATRPHVVTFTSSSTP